MKSHVEVLFIGLTSFGKYKIVVSILTFIVPKKIL